MTSVSESAHQNLHVGLNDDSNLSILFTVFGTWLIKLS